MKILVGVCGSIAAYRSPDFVKALAKAGAQIRVVLTQSAEEFVTVKTLETFSGHPVASADPFSPALQGTDHIAWSRWADKIVVYGATANFLAKIAQGFCDDFLSLQIMSFKGSEVLLVPAMNTVMWNNPLMQANVKTLRSLNYTFVGPVAGTLACGEIGEGHVAEISDIVDAVIPKAQPSVFTDAKILISGGPMRSAYDPVRFLQNTSSGEVALGLAKAFHDLGARPTLLLGPVDSAVRSEAMKYACRIHDFQSFEEYRKLLTNEFPKCSMFLSAAAVLDFTLVPRATKASRSDIGEQKTLPMEISPTEDLVAGLQNTAKAEQLIVAFALESGELETAMKRAREKLLKKGADAIVLNLAESILKAQSKQFQQWILTPDRTDVVMIEATSKAELGKKLVRELATLQARKNQAPQAPDLHV